LSQGEPPFLPKRLQGLDDIYMHAAFALYSRLDALFSGLLFVIGPFSLILALAVYAPASASVRGAECLVGTDATPEGLQDRDIEICVSLWCVRVTSRR
jgi:hypothetical protein